MSNGKLELIYLSLQKNLIESIYNTGPNWVDSIRDTNLVEIYKLGIEHEIFNVKNRDTQSQGSILTEV